jgi:hypothetical protein
MKCIQGNWTLPLSHSTNAQPLNVMRHGVGEELRIVLFWVIRHFQGSRLTHEDGIDRLSETSVRNCRYSLRNNTEQRRSRLLGGGSLKSRTDIALLTL